MSITIGNSITLPGVAQNIINSTNYTVPAGARYLYIFIYVDSGNTSVTNPNLVDYNSVAATLYAAIPTDAGGTGQQQFVYRLANPTAGTHTLRTRHPTLYSYAAAFTVESTNELITSVSSVAYATSTTPSVSIASEVGNVTAYSLTINNSDPSTVAETGGQTVLAEGGASSQAMFQLSTETSAGTTNSATWTSGAQRWSAVAMNFKEATGSIVTLTNPLVAGAAFSGTTTGFLDGAATLTGAGLTIPVTITSGAMTGTITALADNIVYPFLPATGIVWTLTQSALISTVTRDLSVPTGYDVTKTELGVPTNFSDIVTDDSTYLGYWFLAAANALTTNDRAVFPTAFGFKVYPDTAIEIDGSELPETVEIFIQRGSDGKIYSHSISIAEVLSLLELDFSTWTNQITSPRLDGAYPHSIRP